MTVLARSERPLRILYLGQKPIGTRAFHRLIGRQCDGLRVVGAVTNSGLGNWWQDNSIYRWCERHGLPVIANERRNDEAIAALIEEARVNCLISVQHGWVLPAEMIAAVGGCAFNLHLAKLPEYKGWHAFTHALLNGEKRYGLSLHWMVAELDSGEIAFADELAIEADDSAASLYRRAEAPGLALVERLIDCLAAGGLPPRLKLHGAHRYYARTLIDAAREVQDPSDREEVERKARALWFPPFEPAFIRCAGRKIYLVPENAQPAMEAAAAAARDREAAATA